MVARRIERRCLELLVLGVAGQVNGKIVQNQASNIRQCACVQFSISFQDSCREIEQSSGEFWTRGDERAGNRKGIRAR